MAGPTPVVVSPSSLVYATDGTVLPLVPFSLGVFPTTIRVQADRQSGLFSGDFEVGILIKPGPTQNRTVEVTDLVRLYVKGDSQVQFFSQLPYPSEPALFQVALAPAHWDLKTGYIYDLTCEVYITNSSPDDQSVFLLVSVLDLDQTNQVTAFPEKPAIMVRSNTTEAALIALTVSAAVASRTDVKVLVSTGPSKIESHIMVNCDPVAEIPEYYQITTPSILNDITQGQPYNRQFTTAGAEEEGAVTWTVNDPGFLVDHGLRFTQGGVLKSDGNVLGPAPDQKTLIFAARKETGLQTRVYATKLINVIIA